MTATLPPELWAEIASYLRQDELWRIRTVNRTLLRLAWNTRYKEFCLRPSLFSQEYSSRSRTRARIRSYCDLFSGPLVRETCKEIVLVPHCEYVLDMDYYFRKRLNRSFLYRIGYKISNFRTTLLSWRLKRMLAQWLPVNGFTITSLTIDTTPWYFENFRMCLPDPHFPCSYSQSFLETCSDHLTHLTLKFETMEELCSTVLPSSENLILLPSLEMLCIQMDTASWFTEYVAEGITKIRNLYKNARRLKHITIDATAVSPLAEILPTDPSQLPHLQSLTLKGCFTAGKRRPAGSFLTAFASQLSMLYIDYPNPDCSPVIAMNLTSLTIAYSRRRYLEHIPAMLTGCPKLEVLRICCGLTIWPAKLLDPLASLKHLKEFVLDSAYHRIEKDFLVRVLAHVPSLKSLVIGGKELGVPGSRAICFPTYPGIDPGLPSILRRNVPAEGSLESLILFDVHIPSDGLGLLYIPRTGEVQFSPVAPAYRLEDHFKITEEVLKFLDRHDVFT